MGGFRLSSGGNILFSHHNSCEQFSGLVFVMLVLEIFRDNQTTQYVLLEKKLRKQQIVRTHYFRCIILSVKIVRYVR